MKQSIALTTLLAALAVAKPLEKRLLVTDYEIVTVTQTLTGQEAVATAPSSSSAPAWYNGQHWGWHWSSAPAPAPAASTPTTVAPAPAFTPAASSAWSAPSPTSAASTPASTGSVSSYAQSVLDQHNNHRANASVPALVWDDNMAAIAQEIASSCVYAHNTEAGGGGYGQNIGAGTDPSGVPAMLTNEMYNGEINFYPTPYGQANPDMSNFEKWGHYSQMVWKSTTGVGCATVNCPNGLANVGSDVSPWFTVCNYYPPGNYGGQYGDNVLAPGNMASVSL